MPFISHPARREAAGRGGVGGAGWVGAAVIVLIWILLLGGLVKLLT